MLVKNLSVGDGLVNGCRGVVTSFKSSGQNKLPLPVVTFATPLGEIVRMVEMQEFSLESGGRVVATRKQLPLKLVELSGGVETRRGESPFTSRRE